MADRSGKQAGSALGALLVERGSADQDALGRSLLLTLIRLHELGALCFDVPGAVHGGVVGAEPSTDVTPCEPAGLARGAECRVGGRVALDGDGAVVSVPDPETAPAYNMGQSPYIQGGGRE